MAIRRAATALVATVVVATVLAAEPAGGQPAVHYVPPVAAPVADPFRPPATAFGAGNRGLTYDLAPGTPVRAAAAGEVTYAGAVAGTLHVTVLHADGLRTSYSFLESVEVRRGQEVGQGDVVGTGGAGFHLGVRSGDAYLDPAALFGGVEVRVRLVPHEEPLPPTDAGLLRERIALLEKVRERGLLSRVGDFVVRHGQRGLEALGAGLEVYEQLAPSSIAFASAENLAGGLLGLLDCTRGGRPVPEVSAAGRVAVTVAGHNSTSRRAAVDDLQLADVGYRSGDVVRYAYGGGRIPDPEGRLDPSLAGIPARAYDEEATWTDLVAEGRSLADLVEEVADARPGAPIDIYAHSQGGIVAQLALLELAERPGALDRLGHVITMGTPHQGTDLATGAQLLDPAERDSVEWLAGVVGTDLDTDAVSVRQMSEASALTRQLGLTGIPAGVTFRTVGARGDLVVTGDKTSVPGHPSTMLHLAGLDAHDDIPGAAGTTREMRLALAGRSPACPGFGDLVLDATVPEVISWAENGLVAGYAI